MGKRAFAVKLIASAIMLVMLCATGQSAPKLYWGDLHGHSELSDGNKSPYWYFMFSRDSSRLNFAALTDHDFVHGKYLKGYPWSQLVNAAQAYNNDGAFVAIPGYEWTSGWFGHLIVLYRTPSAEIYPFNDDESDTPKKLYAKLKTTGDQFFCIRPHPGSYPVDWWDWDDLISGVEIVGFSNKYTYGIYEYWGCPYSPAPDSSTPGAFVQDILAYGDRVALLGVKDSHDGRPGKAGLTAVYADTLTRAAIFDALKQRHCYATTGARIVLEFNINGKMMGDTLRMMPGQHANITVKTAAPSKILSTEIVKNNSVIYSRMNNDTIATLNWVDQDTVQNGYFYARVTLMNGQMAFSSPIWCKGQDHLPTMAIPSRPTPQQMFYRSEKPLFVWDRSKDADFGDFLNYYIECHQQSTGRTFLLGPSRTDWLWAGDSITAGSSYQWRVVSTTRDEPGVDVITAWNEFRYSDPLSESAKHIFAYPNPFREQINCIILKGKNPKYIEVKVFDLLGRLVKILFKGTNENEMIRATWDGTDIGYGKCRSGVYFIGVFDSMGNRTSATNVTKIK